MSNMHVEEMLEMDVDFDTVLSYQMFQRHYPPPPRFMFDVAKKAIQKYNSGKPDARIKLPEETLFRGRKYATAFEVIESFHLDSFLDNYYEEV